MQWSCGPHNMFYAVAISPLQFASVQNLDYLRDQQILIQTCERGWVVVVLLLGTTLELHDSPAMVCKNLKKVNVEIKRQSMQEF